mmetsp:Transcript_17755/g.36892  ORF Transcript_17755/g.36892 Transcript_17755/m.36892 type:complete len:253 (-) Transcript_17755:865-1623(-)
MPSTRAFPSSRAAVSLRRTVRLEPPTTSSSLSSRLTLMHLPRRTGKGLSLLTSPSGPSALDSPPPLSRPRRPMPTAGSTSARLPEPTLPRTPVSFMEDLLPVQPLLASPRSPTLTDSSSEEPPSSPSSPTLSTARPLSSLSSPLTLESTDLDVLDASSCAPPRTTLWSTSSPSTTPLSLPTTWSTCCSTIPSTDSTLPRSLLIPIPPSPSVEKSSLSSEKWTLAKSPGDPPTLTTSLSPPASSPPSRRLPCT